MVLQKLEEAFWSDEKFKQFYHNFELNKVCYLPFTTFLLKPLQRILHYKLLIDRLINIYPTNHLDRDSCENVRTILLQTAKDIKDYLPGSENYAQLCEFQRDLIGKFWFVTFDIFKVTIRFCLYIFFISCYFANILLYITLGFDNLVQEDRQLIRIGCLLKHSSRGGLQQRIFFLVFNYLIKITVCF